jgi:hypothetical protein
MLRGFLKFSLLLLVLVFLTNCPVLAANWQQLKTKALELSIAGEDDDAHVAYAQAIDKAKEQFGESAPFVGELYFEMGAMDLAAKKFSWANDSLSQACRFMPNSQSAHLKLAELLLLQDRAADARAQATIVLQKQRNNLAARQMLASSYLGLGDKAKAVKEFYNYTLAASGGIVAAPAAKSANEGSKEERPQVLEGKEGKKAEKAVNEESTLLPAANSGLLPAKAPAQAVKGKHGKHQKMESGSSLAHEPTVKPSDAKEKAEARKVKAKAKAKAAQLEEKARKASAKAARKSEPQIVPLKAKQAQLKAKQKALPKGLVPPPPPMVPSFGGFVPPPPTPVVTPAESHAKPKEKVKETAKEPVKETAKEPLKETAKETVKESGKAASKESNGKEHNAPSGEGSDFLLDWAGSKKK